MRKKQLQLVRIIGAILFFVFTTAANSMALECWLVPDTSQCGDTAVNPCHTALSTAVTSTSPACDSIKILPGTYTASNVTVTKNITIFGAETARTFLTGNGGTAITVSGVTSTIMEIRNLTFTNANPGILVQNTSSFNIKNNIFQVGNTATAIQVADTSSPAIMNNTFYQNGTAVLSTPNTLSIVNNIFSGNGLAISANVLIDEIRNNLFFQNSNTAPRESYSIPGTSTIKAMSTT